MYLSCFHATLDVTVCASNTSNHIGRLLILFSIFYYFDFSLKYAVLIATTVGANTLDTRLDFQPSFRDVRSLASYTDGWITTRRAVSMTSLPSILARKSARAHKNAAIRHQHVRLVVFEIEKFWSKIQSFYRLFCANVC